MLWRWNQAAKRYIVTSEGAPLLGRRAGSFVSVDSLNDGREKFIDYQKSQIQKINDDLFSENISITEWVMQMREEIKTAHLSQYMLASGGRNAMTQADYGRVGRVLRDQYAFLNIFAESILTGDLSEAQIRARANLYANSSNASFERGRAASFGLELPAYPSDGATECRANCKCSWSVAEEDGKYLAYWRLSPAEHCDDCLSNAALWNPLVVEQ